MLEDTVATEPGLLAQQMQDLGTILMSKFNLLISSSVWLHTGQGLLLGGWPAAKGMKTEVLNSHCSTHPSFHFIHHPNDIDATSPISDKKT